MSGGVYVRNDETDPGATAYWVYKNLERALAGKGARGRPGLGSHPVLSARRLVHPGTLYDSLQPVVALGAEAHMRLGNVAKTTVLYMNPKRRADAEAVPCDLQGACRAEAHSRLVTLGRRAHAFARVFWPERTLNLDIPPIALDARDHYRVASPRITIFNHSDDRVIGSAVLASALKNEGVAIDCYGFDQEIDSNRVRYREDADIPDPSGDIHVHVGRHSRTSERFRICDSWQSGIPTMLVDAPRRDGEPKPIGIRPDHDVLLCRSADDVSSLVDLLIRNAALGKALAENGRRSAGASSPSWEDLAKEVVQ